MGLSACLKSCCRGSIVEEFVEIREGRARILAPNPILYMRRDGVYEPAWAPVFYNPRMTYNRDIAVLLSSVLLEEKAWSFLEPLSGTGVRGIRLLLEAGAEYGVLNDAGREACRLTARNLLLNKLDGRAAVYCTDASLIMLMLAHTGMHFDYIDIDPFGSPMPFLESALRVSRRGGILAVTATDTAPLSGTHPASCLRRYRAKPLRIGPSRETALRILVGAVARRAAEQDIAARPILAYYADYYLRAYFSLEKGARKADSLLGRIGVLRCLDEKCLEAELAEEYPPACGEGLWAGPLWAGRLCDTIVVEKLKARLSEAKYLQTSARIKRMLESLLLECTVNKPYIRVDRLSGALRTSMPSPRRLASYLSELGFHATPSSFDPRAIATDAPMSEVKKALLHLAGK